MATAGGAGGGNFSLKPQQSTSVEGKMNNFQVENNLTYPNIT
jgi:hypothetical protein